MKITYFPAMVIAVFYWLMVLVNGMENHHASVDRWDIIGVIYLLTAWFGTFTLIIFVFYMMFKKKGEKINF